MNKPVDMILQQALALPEKDREHLVRELLTSLGSRDGDIEVDAAAAAEIQRRIDALRSGSVKPVAVGDVFDRIEAQLAARNGKAAGDASPR